MSRTVGRYLLAATTGRFPVNMPLVHKVLTIRKGLDGLPYVCIIIDNESPMSVKNFYVIKEGESSASLGWNREYYGMFDLGGVNYYVFNGDKIGA